MDSYIPDVCGKMSKSNRKSKNEECSNLDQAARVEACAKVPFDAKTFDSFEFNGKILQFISRNTFLDTLLD